MLTFLRRVIRALTLCGLWLLMLGVAASQGHAATPDAAVPKVLVVGDSISAAYGMALEQGWVALLAHRLADHEPPYSAVNASISGDTTGGGLRRLPTLLSQHQPAVVVIELGGNDGLRGYPIDQLRSNLRQMVAMAQDAGARVLVLPMEVPPNLGKRYTGMFRESFTTVTEETGATLGGFPLEGIALDDQLMQADGIHPTVAAQSRILENVWLNLAPLLRR